MLLCVIRTYDFPWKQVLFLFDFELKFNIFYFRRGIFEYVIIERKKIRTQVMSKEDAEVYQKEIGTG